jgi:hypothetical protein
MRMFMRTDTGALVTEEERYAVLHLLRFLYRLKIIDDNQTMDIVTKYQITFV